MDKLGIAPPNYETDVGKMRLALGDTDYEPVGSGSDQGLYEYFSDVELEAYLTMADGVFALAVANAALGMSAKARDEEIRTDDLTVKDKESAHWLTIYSRWKDIADSESSYVDVVFPESPHCWPEAMPRTYTWGRC